MATQPQEQPQHNIFDVLHALIDKAGFNEADAAKHRAAVDEADDREAWEAKRAPVDYATGTPVQPVDNRDAVIAQQSQDIKTLQEQIAQILAGQNVRAEHVEPVTPDEPVNPSPVNPFASQQTQTPQE